MCWENVQNMYLVCKRELISITWGPLMWVVGRPYRAPWLNICLPTYLRHILKSRAVKRDCSIKKMKKHALMWILGYTRELHDSIIKMGKDPKCCVVYRMTLTRHRLRLRSNWNVTTRSIHLIKQVLVFVAVAVSFFWFDSKWMFNINCWWLYLKPNVPQPLPQCYVLH